MYICIYVCMYICIYVYMYMCICIHIYVYICVYTYIYACIMYVYMLKYLKQFFESAKLSSHIPHMACIQQHTAGPRDAPLL